MILLIDKDFVASKLQVAIGFDSKEFNSYVREAQLFDFKAIVREEFFMDVLANKDDPKWKLLIDGDDYEFKGRTYQFEGIATILAYFSYARFVMSSSAVSTSFGMVVKTNPNSQPLGLEERKNYYYKKKAEAGLLFNDLKAFVERKIIDYPSWKDQLDNCRSTNKRTFKTSIIQ
jgi:hypothetical protein